MITIDRQSSVANKLERSTGFPRITTRKKQKKTNKFVRVLNSIGIGFPPIDLMGRFYVELCFFSRITDETPYVLNEKIGRDEGNFVSFSREEGYGQPSPRPQTMRPRWTKLRWPNIHCNLQGPHQVDWILLNFTGFFRVLPGFTWFLLGFQKVPLR